MMINFKRIAYESACVINFISAKAFKISAGGLALSLINDKLNLLDMRNAPSSMSLLLAATVSSCAWSTSLFVKDLTEDGGLWPIFDWPPVRQDARLIEGLRQMRIAPAQRQNVGRVRQNN